jgi:hypothetical protein
VRDHRYIVRQTLWVLDRPQSVTVGAVRVEITKARVLRILLNPMTPELYVMANFNHMHTSPQEQDLITRMRIMESTLDFMRRNWKNETRSKEGITKTENRLAGKIDDLAKQLARLKAERERRHPVPKPTLSQLAAAKKALAAMPPPHPLSQSLELEGKLYPSGPGPVWAEQTYITRSRERQTWNGVNGSRFVRLTSEGVPFHGGWPATKENLEGHPARLFIQIPVTQELPTRTLTFPVPEGSTAPADGSLRTGGDEAWRIRLVQDKSFGARRPAAPGTRKTRMLTFRVDEKAADPMNPVTGQRVDLMPVFNVAPPWKLHWNHRERPSQPGWKSVTYGVELEEGEERGTVPPVEVRFAPSRRLKGLIRMELAELTLPLRKG